MKRTKEILGLLALLLVIGVLLMAIFHPAKSLSLDDPDAIAIEKTMRTFEEIKARSNFTADGIGLDQVLANDPRGGKSFEMDYQLVRYMKRDPNLKEDQMGLLDYFQSLYACRRLAGTLFNEAVQSGRFIIPTPVLNAPANNSVPADFNVPTRIATPTPYDQTFSTDPYADTWSSPDKVSGPHSLPEIRALEKKGGTRCSALPRALPAKLRVLTFTIQSITVESDLAHVVAKYQDGLYKEILVKKGGNWYLIGEKLLKDTF